MDAQFAWTCLTTAWQDADLKEAAVQAGSLLAWIEGGGTPPETAVETPAGMGDLSDETVALAVCRMIGNSTFIAARISRFEVTSAAALGYDVVSTYAASFCVRSSG